MKELKDGNCYTCMGCRSFLTPYVDENNQPPVIVIEEGFI